ncbi:hypothetical protein J2T57_001244 [Natronocella acetinitrilica]|uniref:DUF1064 domain-containing protein n=1 Tax=Natronocella acetinitrilica TaxID=414046 RepID=A0AAE3G5C0_9GAMM|nr:DUF1064 domain-containing protein [Natronocella acetinitrilica]MCP1674142.1 hypothetical protein [Natronocella acetinitrilica]
MQLRRELLSAEDRAAIDGGRLSASHYRELLVRGALRAGTRQRPPGAGAPEASSPVAQPPAAQKQPGAEGVKPRPSKMGNRKTTINGQVFDSGWEAERYLQLRADEASGLITDLRTQVAFAIIINDMHVCDYVCDFAYLDADGEAVVEDAKGYLTPMYRLKKKLMRAVHGIEIRESYRPKKTPRSGRPPRKRR